LSLTGNLEDLPLLDIIQIVSFSKKTGYLTIRTEHGDAAIVFKDGYIVSSFAWDSPPPDARAGTLPPDKRQALVRNRIEMALEQLIRLRDGQFSFSLTDDTPKVLGGRDLQHDTVNPGLNAQELLLDLARGIDEDRRDSSAALEASFAEPADEPFGEAGGADPAVATFVQDVSPPAPAGQSPTEVTIPFAPVPKPAAKPPAAPAGAEPNPAVLLVDDEEQVRQILSDRFIQGGYEVVEAEDPDSALKKANRLGKAGVRFILVTDLGMPTSGGSSFHGGFEVVKRLWKMGQYPPVLMMTESLSPALQARAKQMGITSFVFKPGLSKLDPQQFEADLKAFAGKILDDVLPRLARGTDAAKSGPRAGKVASKLQVPATPVTAEELTREFSFLQRHLEDLRRTTDPSQVSTLVMKVAREFFERGILFLVKNEEVRGLGGFGPAPRGESLNLLVRDVVVPLSEPSVFLEAASGRKGWSGALPDGKWNKYLMGKVGRYKSEAVALFPLLAHRQTIALLFGDNPETGRDFGRLEALEVFINQAGVALENAFLQRKLQALQQRRA
jgi:CheY-like chemotaxis protein